MEGATANLAMTQVVDGDLVTVMSWYDRMGVFEPADP
jgi:hypothetical protein